MTNCELRMVRGANCFGTLVRCFSVSCVLFVWGCDGGGLGGDRIREMEFHVDNGVATFVIPEHDWLAPFSKPTITEFAVATPDDDENVVWRLAADTETGVPARGMAITFGTPPAGFRQIAPDESSRPRPLVPGRNYYVAAGGPTNVYRLIFAMPVEVGRPAEQPTSAPVDEAFPSKDMWEKMRQTTQPAEDAPVEDPAMKPETAEPPTTDEAAPPAEEEDTPPKKPSIFGE